MTFEIAPGGRAITCLICGLTSHNPNDVEQAFCGHCKVFHRDPLTLAVYRLILEREPEDVGETILFDCGHRVYTPIKWSRPVMFCASCLEEFLKGDNNV